MARQILKSILLGILIGTLFFIMPFFIFKFLLFFLLIGAICRLWWGGRYRGWKHRNHAYYAYTDKIRNMSDDEYEAYKNKWKGHYNGYGYHCGHHYYGGCWNEPANKTATKNDSTNI